MKKKGWFSVLQNLSWLTQLGLSLAAPPVLCLLGAFLGSVAVFAVVRKWGVPLVEVFFPKEKLNKLAFLKTSPKRTALLWLVFTVPGTPKDLLCYFAGLTDLPWRTWLLIATVGRLPSIVQATQLPETPSGRPSRSI